MQCLNLKNKEVKAAVDELATVLGSEDAAYYIVSENNGYAIDQAPDGAQSTVFLQYLKQFNGNRELAIKAMIQHYVPQEVEQRTDMKAAMFPQQFTETNANDTMSNMINSELYYQNQFSKDLVQQFSPDFLKNIKVKLVSELGGAMAYNANINTIEVLDKTFNRESPEDITKHFNHELIHAYTVSEYDNNSTFRSNVDSIYNKLINKFPQKEYPRKGLYYGLKSPKEFISEIMSNTAFRDLVGKHDMSIWRKFLSNIVKALRLNKLANKIEGYTSVKLINEISDIIEDRNSNPDINRLGDGIFYMEDSDPELNKLSKDSKKILDKIMSGLNGRYRSLRTQNYPPLQLAKLQQQIDMYHDMLQKGEDVQVLIDFIKESSVAFKPVVKRIRNAYMNPDLISNERLLQFQNDFLDFYGPMINEINKRLNLQGYFSDLDKDTHNQLNTRLNLIYRAYLEISGKYDSILKSKVETLIKQYSEAYKVPSEDVESYINDRLNNSNSDINYLRVILQSTKSVDDLAIRLAHRLMTDINNEVGRFANDKAQTLIREFNKIDRKDCLLYFEKDINGNTTGYLVRDRNYGQFRQDMKKFLSDLDSKYGVVDNNYAALELEDYYNYLKEKEEWLEQHCERKFKPEYYRAYNELHPNTRLRLKQINTEINTLIEDVTDETGPHLERLTNKQWLQLDSLYSVKRNLANDYYQNGELKTGEDKEIAEDLQKFYETIGQGKIKSTKYSQEEIQNIIDQKKQELSEDLFNKWMQRNISYQYTEEFTNLLQSLERANMGEDQQKYDDLTEERRKLLSLGRNNNQPLTDAYKLQEEVKARLLEIDIELNALYSKHKGSSSEFSKIAKIVETPEYYADKKKYKSLGTKEYDEWVEKSHTWINGKPSPVSYYKMLVPKDTQYVEMRLSRMNQELDKDSELVNKNYNFEDPEYYQPKKSLYDNTKAFKEATNTKQKKEIYNLIVNTMNEANAKISFLKKRESYKLPQITGDIVDFTTRGNKFAKGIKSFALDNIIAKQDDAEYSLDNFTQKPDGSQLQFVPTHYVKALDDPEHISRNLVGMLVEYSRMAENYRLKNEKQADFELIKNEIAKRDFTKFNFTTRSKQDITGDKSNLYKRYQDFLDMNLYGQYKRPIAVNVLGYNISVTKILDNIRAYATASNLGNNVPAITKALFQGIHKSVVEALAGRYFSSKEYFKSLATNTFNIPNMLYHLGDAKHNNLSLAILEHNEIARDVSSKVEYLQYNRAFRVFRKYLIWGGWSAVDYIVKAPVVNAVYADYKYIPQMNSISSRRQYIRQYYPNDYKKGSKEFDRINTFTLLDVYEVKDGKLSIKSKYNKYSDLINDQNLQNSVKNIAKFLTNRIDGVLSTEDKTKMMTNAFGAAVFMHRSFFINNLEDNFLTTRQYNPYVEDYIEAKYKSTFSVLYKFIYNIYNSIKYNKDKENRKKHRKGIDNIEAYNFRRTAIQIALVTMYSILSAIWLKPTADDNEDEYLLQLIGYGLAGMSFEERAEYNLMDFFNQIKSPSAAIAPIENFSNLVKLLDPFSIENNWDDEEIKKGPYKEMTKWLRTLIKSIPGLRGIWESKDIRTKWEYLDSQLDKTTNSND